jgi:hypothetical protein
MEKEMWNKTENVSRQNPPGRVAPPPKQASAGYDDVFDAIGGATPYESGVYVELGVYPLLYVDVIKMLRSRKGDDLFIAEFDILDSQVGTRPKGSRMSWICSFRHEASPGNIKKFLAAVMNTPIEEVDAQGAKYACSAENPCHGRLVRLAATETETRSGNPFTLCRYSPIGDVDQSRAEQLRGEAGFQTF